MNDFFKFDDKRVVSSLLLIVSIFLLVLSVFSVKVIEVFIASIFALIITIVGCIFVFNEGIHFNYKKEKIVIVIGMMIKTIPMREVKSFVLKEIPKDKKGFFTQIIEDPVDSINLPSKYVYNKGKTFNIVFYLKEETVTIYYGWLYKTTSLERIDKQLKHFQSIREKFMHYKNNC